MRAVKLSCIVSVKFTMTHDLTCAAFWFTADYLDWELEPEATVSKMETVRLEGGRQVAHEVEHYNLFSH
jgi:hypothetical protein